MKNRAMTLGSAVLAFNDAGYAFLDDIYRNEAVALAPKANFIVEFNWSEKVVSEKVVSKASKKEAPAPKAVEKEKDPEVKEAKEVEVKKPKKEKDK